MADRPPKILICSCEDTMPLDASAVQRGCRGAEVLTAHQLCRAELEKFRAAAESGGPLIVGCTQEVPLFSEIAGDAAVTYANIRETAGWSKDGAAAGPKMAALLAAAAEPAPELAFVNLTSDGVILIYGRDEQAIEAGNLLKDHLDVTVLIRPPADVPPPRVTDFPVVRGAIRSAKGYLGAFELTVDGYAQPDSLVARRTQLSDAHAMGRCPAATSCSTSPAAHHCSPHRTCVTAICAPIPAIPQPCSRPCSRRAISSAVSTSRVTWRTPRISAPIRARRSSAARAASISVPPARSRLLAIMSPSMPISARAADNARPFARPAPPPMRCRRRMR